MQNLSAGQKNAIFLAILAFLLFAGWNINSLISNSSGQKIDIITAPGDTEVYLEGQKISDDSIRLSEGTYTFVGKREGFYDQTKQIEISTETEVSVELYLIPANDETKKQVAEAEGGNFAYDEAFDPNTAADPVLFYLPYENFLYSMEADTTNWTPSDPVVIKVNAFRGYRNAAADRIQSSGLTPSDYRYVFENYEDPFK